MWLNLMVLVVIGVVANALSWWLLADAVDESRSGMVLERMAVMRYGKRITVVAAALTLALAALLVVVVAAPPAISANGAPLVAILLAASSLLLLEAWRRRVIVSDRAVVSSGPFGSRALTWSEVRAIHFNPFVRMLVIHARDGRCLRVNPSLSGMDFLEFLASEKLSAGQCARAFHALREYRS